jgi:hypothetical protein
MKYQPSTRYRPYVQAALRCGHWEPLARTVDGGGHALLRHKETGVTVTYALHDGGNEWNGARNMAKALQDACGCQFIEPRNRKRSRKKIETSGFDPALAACQNAAWSREVDGLREQHATLTDEIKALAVSGNRTAVAEARDLVAQVLKVEQRLAELHQPFVSVTSL